MKNCDYIKRYNEWISNPYFDREDKEELLAIKDEEEIYDRFYKELRFGTGGLRGIIGMGTNRMNKYTVTKATQGLANYIMSLGQEAMYRGVVIAYDSRIMSKEFAQSTALCLNANGICTYIFPDLRPTPECSFAVRYLRCIAGVVITASHNPPEYNGYKVYWEDGGQIVPPHDKNIMEQVAAIGDYASIKGMSLDSAVENGLFHILGEDVDEEYYVQLMRQTIHSEYIKEAANRLRIVYTPLHGTGMVPVAEVLKRLGFQNVYVVLEQEKPDGKFPTVKSPNPENKEAFSLAIELAIEVDADIILATDPDADRLGIYVKDVTGVMSAQKKYLIDKESYPYVCFNANMTGALMAEYVLREKDKLGLLPDNGALLSTIVTTNLARRIADFYHVKYIETLTGFKYIGEQIKLFERDNSYSFVYGMEESYGCLVGAYTRDKDACGAVAILCEISSYYVLQDKSLCDALIDLYEKYGYYVERAYSKTMKGERGSKEITDMMKKLRKSPPDSIGGINVLAVRDYARGIRLDKSSGEEQSLGLPQSEVLYFEMEGDAWCAIRPSGTEPKIKYYFGVCSNSFEQAESCLKMIKESITS